MNNVKNTAPVDVLAFIQGTSSAKGKKDSQDLSFEQALAEAMQTETADKATKPAKPETQEKAPEQSEATEQREPDDAVISAAVQPQVSAPAVPEQEAAAIPATQEQQVVVAPLPGPAQTVLPQTVQNTEQIETVENTAPMIPQQQEDAAAAVQPPVDTVHNSGEQSRETEGFFSHNWSQEITINDQNSEKSDQNLGPEQKEIPTEAPQIPVAEGQTKLDSMIQNAQQELVHLSQVKEGGQELPVENPAPVQQETPVEEVPENEVDIPGPTAVQQTEEPEEPPKATGESASAAETQQPEKGPAPARETVKQAEQFRTQEISDSDAEVVKASDKQPLQPLKPTTNRDASRETESTPDTQQVQQNWQPQQPVRSAEPQPTAQSKPQVTQAEQIHQEILENVEKGRTEFRMQLQPNDLGKIDVKLVLENGSLAVEIMAANPKTVELLTRQAENLMGSLKMQEMNVESVQVVEQSHRAEGDMESAFNMQGGQAQQQQDAPAGKTRGRSSSFGTAADEIPADQQDPQRTPDTLLNTRI